MASFRRAGDSMTIPKARQRVLIGGSLRSDAYCLGIAQSAGSGGAVATLDFPAIGWDDEQGLRGRSVEVYQGLEGGPLVPVFAGSITSINRTARGERVQATSGSALTMAHRVYIGQGAGGALDVVYPAGTSVAAILREWWSSNGVGRLPVGWRSRLELGDLTAVARAFARVNVGELRFLQTTLAEALDEITLKCGTLGYRERFLGDGRTLLEFFLLRDAAAPAVRVRVARPGASAAGTNVEEIGRNESLDDTVTRIIATGDRRRFVVSLTSDHATAPLLADWDPTLEAAVLADPEVVKSREETGIDAEMARVFREFRLPPQFDWWVVESANALRGTSGNELRVQVWKMPLILQDNGAGGWSSVAGLVPREIAGQLDPRTRRLTLREPALNIVSAGLDVAGNAVTVYEPAVVGVTVTLAGDPIGYDTGVRAVYDQALGADGFTETLANTSFGFVQVGGTIAGHNLTSTWVLQEDGVWQRLTTPTVIRNDYAGLRRFAEGVLRERLRESVGYDVQVPWFAPAFGVGARVRVVGDDGYRGTHQIMAVRYDTTRQHGTAFSTTTQVPITTSTVRPR